MLGNLSPFRKGPAQHTENGHSSALRKGTSYIFDYEKVALGAAAVALVRFVTGDKAMVFEGGDVSINQEDILFEIFEESIFSAPGAENTDYARHLNRIKGVDTEILFYDTPTVTSPGNVVLHQHVLGAAGQNQNQPGFGSGGQDASTVFQPNTEHLLRITSASALAAHIEIHFFFHQAEVREYS